MGATRLLLVDDEEIVLRALSRDLNAEGYEVAAVGSGQDALLRLGKDVRFDVVITDLVMEGLDGIQVLREARRLDPEVGVIILTGHGALSSAIDALRLGADDYLLKPCATEELLLRIRRCQERQELRRKLKLYENILPICAVCKMIRDDSGKGPGQGEWLPVDVYITRKTGVLMSHTYCPECGRKALQELIR
ncbi:MAG: response regulator [Thermodesulfobacteriota bacterium]